MWRRPCDHTGRLWNDVATSQGTPRVPAVLGRWERGLGQSLTAFRRKQPNGYCDFGLPASGLRERFLLFCVPRFVVLVTTQLSSVPPSLRVVPATAAPAFSGCLFKRRLVGPPDPLHQNLHFNKRSVICLLKYKRNAHSPAQMRLFLRPAGIYGTFAADHFYMYYYSQVICPATPCSWPCHQLTWPCSRVQNYSREHD